MSDGVITRRGFVAGAVAGVAFGAGALGSNGRGKVPVAAASKRRTSANDQIAVGLIGTGKRLQDMIGEGLLKNPRLRIVAACDVDKTRREHYKGLVDAQYGNSDCATYGVDDELLARDDIDGVLILTPDHWHATQCLKACATNPPKHIYCEKPLTHTLHEGRVLTEAVRRAGVAFLTGSQQRTEYGHRFVRAAEIVRTGMIGKLLNVNIGVGDPPRPCDLGTEEMEPGLDWDRWLGPAPKRGYHSDLSPRSVHTHYPSWRHYREYSGGYLADIGAHMYDIAQWAMDMDGGGPLEVHPPEDDKSLRGVRLVYPNDVIVTHGGPAWRVVFVGTEGMVTVWRDGIRTTPEDVLEKEVPAGATALPRHQGHINHWLDCIEGNATPVCGAEVGARTAAACQLVSLAYQLRRPLKWDAAAWKFIGDDEANGLLDYERRGGFGLPAK